MLLKDFKRINLQDEALNRIQDNVDSFVSPLLRIPILDGILLENQTIKTQDTPIAHKLGRAYKGFLITYKNGVSDVYATGGADPKTFLVLKGTQQVICDLWVF